MKKIKKGNVGIFGGSFDPPHKGHVYIARLLIKKLKLEKLIWSVSKKNPLEKKNYYYSFEKRKTLSKSITKNIKKIFINNFDKKYSYQLINLIKKKNISKKFYFLIGSDNIQNLHKWKNLSQIMNTTTLVIIERPGYKRDLKKSLFFKKYYKYLYKNYENPKLLPRKSWIYIKDKGVKISSSNIKNRLYKKN